MDDNSNEIKPMTHEDIKHEIDYLVTVARNMPLPKKTQRTYAALVHAFCMVLGYENLSHYETHNVINTNAVLERVATALTE